MEKKVKWNLRTSNRQPQNVPKMSFEGPLRNILRPSLKEHPWEVDSRHLWGIKSRRPRDGQIGSLGDVLGTLEGDILGTSWFLLVNIKILYSTQFGFQKGPLTEHKIAQLADEIHELFENSNYMLGFFIDLSKVFVTIDHTLLLTKLESYVFKGTNVAWFGSYLTNRKQYSQITNDSETDLRNTACRVPQDFILGPLLFLVYVDDFPSSSKILNLIISTKIS